MENDSKDAPTLWAVSDLHVNFRGNEEILSLIKSSNPHDWLIVAGDVTEKIDVIVETLETLATRFAKVIWVPGNHELYTTARDPHQFFGVTRYEYLVEQLRMRGIITPEDPYPIFQTEGKSYRIVPLFLLYDYGFLPGGFEGLKPIQALAKAREVNVIATDEMLISPEPYATKEAWCRERVRYSLRRLAELGETEETILINHWPLRQEPCELLFDPEFSLWCGTQESVNWHKDYRAKACVYGHLHLPRTTWYDGVRFEEVSIGYAREWKMRGLPNPLLRQILPDPGITEYDLSAFGLHFMVDPQRAIAARREHEARRLELKKKARALLHGTKYQMPEEDE